MKNLACAALVAAGFALPASAAILDFETGFANDVTAVAGNAFQGGFGVVFTSNGNLNVVKVGNPTDGFVPNDTPDPADALGEFFLSAAFDTKIGLTIDYDTAVMGASFDVADIDGAQNGPGQLETFTFKAFNGGSLLDTQVIDGNSAGAGDKKVVRVGFSGIGLFDQIVIEGVSAGGNRQIGIAFDNFDTQKDTTAPIPLPAAAWMLLAGLGGLGVLARRRNA